MRLCFRFRFVAAIEIAKDCRQPGTIVRIERSHGPSWRADRPADNIETTMGDSDMGLCADEFANREQLIPKPLRFHGIPLARGRLKK